MKFAIYRETEVAVRYFNGAGYVVRHDMFPHTGFGASGPVTRQGHVMLVGARQGLTDTAGFTIRTYRRPDTAPTHSYGSDHA